MRHSRANSLRCIMPISPYSALQAYRPETTALGSPSITSLASSSQRGTHTVSASWTKIRSRSASEGRMVSIA